jgi:hypothetical protein
VGNGYLVHDGEYVTLQNFLQRHSGSAGRPTGDTAYSLFCRLRCVLRDGDDLEGPG